MFIGLIHNCKYTIQYNTIQYNTIQYTGNGAPGPWVDVHGMFASDQLYASDEYDSVCDTAAHTERCDWACRFGAGFGPPAGYGPGVPRPRRLPRRRCGRGPAAPRDEPRDDGLPGHEADRVVLDAGPGRGGGGRRGAGRRRRHVGRAAAGRQHGPRRQSSKISVSCCR